MRAAYALACEHWLIDAEVDDLLAVVPDKIFMQFLESGRGRHYYRKLPESLSLKEQDAGGALYRPIEQLAEDLGGAGPRAPLVVSFSPPRGTGGDGGSWLSLISILWRSGRAHARADEPHLLARPRRAGERLS